MGTLKFVCNFHDVMQTLVVIQAQWGRFTDKVSLLFYLT